MRQAYVGFISEAVGGRRARFARRNLAMDGAILICRARFALGSSSAMCPIVATALQLGGVAMDGVERWRSKLTSAASFVAG